MPDREIALNIDASRIKASPDGGNYVDVTPEDFAQVPPATLAYWYDRFDAGDEKGEVPISVNIVGGKLPPGQALDIIFHPVAGGAPFRMATTRPENVIDIRRAGDTLAAQLPNRPFLEGFSAMSSGLVSRDSFDTAHPAALGVGRKRTRSVDPVSLRARDVAGHKLQPTLSDQLMFEKRAFPGAVPRKIDDAVRQAHRTSRAFVFDRSASYRVGEICAYEPDLIADSQEFARAPYPRTFVELDANALLDALQAAGAPVIRDDTRDKDERIGFLFTERGIYTASGGATDARGFVAGFSPFAYRPHQPMTRDQELRFTHEFGCSRMMIDQFMWGSAYDLLDASRRRSLRAQHGIDVLLEPQWNKGAGGGLSQLLQGGGAGDLKVALCCLLLLIRPNMLHTIETREPGRKLIAGKPTTFIAHRVVTIRLTPDQTVRKIRRACKEEAGRAKARWHEVRGHYMHNHRAKVAGCVHDWQQLDDYHWECRNGCGGTRTWRTYPDGRGTAEVGVVTKHYVVKR